MKIFAATRPGCNYETPMLEPEEEFIDIPNLQLHGIPFYVRLNTIEDDDSR
jgi:hypothetical protein